jgi:hypothetical protein
MANQLLLLLHATRARFYNAIDIIILLLTPAFLCLAVPDWIFARPHPIYDSYVYLGYFRNFGHQVTFTYWGTRLPFIIPGYICYKISPPLIANYVLHLGFYYVALFSLYFILRIAVNKRAALLTAALMGFYPYFMATMGWDYVDGAGIAYFLLTLLLLTMAAKSPHIAQTPRQKQRSNTVLSKKCGILLFLAGMSFAALIYTQTFLLIMTPSLVLYYLIMRPQPLSLLLKSVFIAGSGVIMVTILFGIVNVAIGGSFLFFERSFDFAWWYLTEPGTSPWFVAYHWWLPHAPHTVFPFFIFLTSLLFIIVSLVRVKSGLFTVSNLLQIARDNIFSLCHLLNFSFMLIMQLLGKPVFQYQFYASYLLPTAFLAAGAQLAASLSRLGKSQYTGIATITVFLLAGSYLIYYHTPLRSLMSQADSMWYVSAMLVAGTLCLFMADKRRRTINTLLVSLALLLFASTNITLFPTKFAQMAYCACEQRKEKFLALIKSDDILRPYDANGKLRIWYSWTEPLGELYTGIVTTGLRGHRLINNTFPKAETIKIPPGTEIVILSGDKDALLKANAALNLLGLQANLIRTEEITQGSSSFTMTFIRAEAY